MRVLTLLVYSTTKLPITMDLIESEWADMNAEILCRERLSGTHVSMEREDDRFDRNTIRTWLIVPGLAKQASQITMYDVKSYYNQAKNMVLNLSEMEAKVAEATNNDPW